MRPELFDGARRLALVDLGAVFDEIGIDGSDRDHVESVTMGAFDDLLGVVEAATLPRDADGALLRLVFVRIWPILRAHVAPLLLADPRAARRLRDALEARRRAGWG